MAQNRELHVSLSIKEEHDGCSDDEAECSDALCQTKPEREFRRHRRTTP